MKFRVFYRNGDYSDGVISVVFLIVVLNLIIGCSPAIILYEGQPCRNPDGQDGTCTIANSCPPADLALKKKRMHNFKRCSFDHFDEIVCCPNTELTTTTKTIPPITTTETNAPELRGTKARKSEKACQEYSKAIGIKVAPFIVNGLMAEEGEFPHMAALGMVLPENEAEGPITFDCGGTLISHKFIVSAAHCIVTLEQKKLKYVRLGIIILPPSLMMKDVDPKVDHEVNQVIVHPDYKWKAKINDLALVELKTDVSFSELVGPACLYHKSDLPGRLIVSGWGLVALGGDKSPDLQWALLTPVSFNECNATYTQKLKRGIIETQICAADDKSDACQGDSGGPLQIQNLNSSVYSLVGVISYGVGCGAKIPGIFTRIYSYLDWIESKVWP